MLCGYELFTPFTLFFRKEQIFSHLQMQTQLLLCYVSQLLWLRLFGVSDSKFCHGILVKGARDDG
jgi:hypothetical protein